MPRAMTTRRPTAAELRQLRQLLQTATDRRQVRRAEAIVLYAEGWDATAISQFLTLHPHTVHFYLHAFDRWGVPWVRQDHRGGTPARISAEQQAALCRLADQAPAAVGLPYGRWSLAKLRDYAVRHRVVRAISREYLRQILAKG
jgi:transposase